MTGTPSAPDITVVVVLYGTTPATSVALTTLSESLADLAPRFAVEVHDNSPEPATSRSVPGLAVAVDRVHPDNPGLVVPYNEALESAQRRGSTWLMLLDQDTRVTRQYLAEVVDFVDGPAATQDVAVAAPRLRDGRGILSPHKPIRFEVRPLEVGRTYLPSSSYAYLNSGALMRVDAGRAVGGFPVEFPLDFLDHAMSARLKAAGFSLFTLTSVLEHQLSVRDMETVPAARLESIFRSEDRYYSEAGRGEAFWMVARRGARGILLALGVHRSAHRALELEVVWRGVKALAVPRPRSSLGTGSRGGA